MMSNADEHDAPPPLGAGLDLTDPNGPLAPYYASNAGIIATLVLTFLAVIFSYQHLWNTDIWGHVAYGEWMAQHGIPEHEPLNPYTDKQARFGPFSWLAQRAYATLVAIGQNVGGSNELRGIQYGAEFIRLLHWFAQVATYVIFWIALRRLGVSTATANVGLIVMSFAEISTLGIQRPQAFGALFFVITFCACSTPLTSRRTQFGLPLLFVLWANIHGSFAVGLLFLGIHWLGYALTLMRQRQSIFAGECVRRFALMLACLLATLVNPHGPMMYLEIMQLGSHPNIRTVSEWQSLKWNQGLAIVILGGTFALTLLTFIARIRQVSLIEWMLFIAFAFWGVYQQRMILWWFLLFAWINMPHWQAIFRNFGAREMPADSLSRKPTLSFRKTLVVGAIIFFGITMTPWFELLEKKFNRTPEQTFAGGTCWPLAMELKAEGEDRGKYIPKLAEALKTLYPQGRYTGPIFATETQADFLLFTQPADRPVLMFSHAHAFPADHWDKCLDVKQGAPQWRQYLDEWKANLIVAEPIYNPGLIEKLRADSDWLIVLDETQEANVLDERSRKVVALRKKPLINRPE